MKTMISEAPSRILRHRIVLEKKLGVRIQVKGNVIILDGGEFEEYQASRVIEALGAHFDLEIAFLLLNEDYLFEKLDIKDISRRKTNRKDVRARVIGRNGRALELVGELSDCYLTTHGNDVFVIGPAESIKIAVHAMTALIRGSKHSSVYAYLEKQRVKRFEEAIAFKNLK